jgi:hypothetical protein
MAKKTDTPSDGLDTDDGEGWLSGMVADEDDLDRPSLWRLGAWGVGAVGAMIVGLMAVQLPVNAQRTQLAAGDIAGHTQRVEHAIRENSLEARRLATAIETLSGDRDRAFTRLSALEQGLEGVTGSISKMDERMTPVSWPSVAAPVLDSPPAAVAVQQAVATMAAPVAPATTPARTQAAPAAERTEVMAAIEPQAIAIPLKPPSVIEAKPIPEAQAATETNAPIQVSAPVHDDALAARTDFGVDLGSAHSMDGLRALWRGVSSAHKTQFEGLRPVIAVQERKNGLGVQLRLIAGPIKDAATAARICAVLSDADRDCKTAAFEGQRLSLPNKPVEAAPTPAPRKPRRQSAARTPPPVSPPAAAQPAAPAAEPAAEPSTLASLLRFR